MTYGFSLVVRGNDATPENFTQIAERAEALQIDTLWCSAHTVLPPQVRSGYAARHHAPGTLERTLLGAFYGDQLSGGEDHPSEIWDQYCGAAYAQPVRDRQTSR